MPSDLKHGKDTLAERSKAVAQGAIPKGRGFEPHSCHFAHAPRAEERCLWPPKRRAQLGSFVLVTGPIRRHFARVV